MNMIIYAGILTIFLIWAHKTLLQYHAQGSVNTQDTLVSNEVYKYKSSTNQKIFYTLLLYLTCYGFISLNLWFYQSFYINNTASTIAYNIASFQSKQIKNENIADKPMSYTEQSGLGMKNTIELISPNRVKTRFIDVAGLSEAKEDIQDIIQFLQNPKIFSRLGAKAPKGLIMSGPPGTGKTLLARALAGESNVSFIAASGAQFEEEYIGVGAARVRQLFKLGRKHAPCVIFIDEIDALAFKRSSGKTSPWIAQTVNQLLTEMDGLNEDHNSGVIVVAASNRIGALDPAILRSGRFDRHVKLELPTLQERDAILKVHLQKIKFDPKTRPNILAKITIGFSGADLANLINESAIDATKKNKLFVDMSSFEIAKERMILGNMRKSIKMDKKETKLIAYHEAGHAMISMFLAKYETVYKATIIPRGISLGHTTYHPQHDKYSYSKQYLEHSIATSLGGRVAEEIVFGHNGTTTGAEDDFTTVTDIAYKMVTKWGFSKRLGILNDPEMKLIDKKIIECEVQKILKRSYKLANFILSDNEDKLHHLANELLNRETLSGKEIKIIIGPIKNYQSNN